MEMVPMLSSWSCVMVSVVVSNAGVDAFDILLGKKGI
jgi:hypothetical protein